MIIRRVNENELDQALDLVYKVFMEYEAPDYPAEGVESFVNDIIKNEGFKIGGPCTFKNVLLNEFAT